MLELLLYLLIGCALGIIFGLIPGLHPNLIILLLPVLISMNLDTFHLLSFIIGMGITNSIVDFIPSILLGAPDVGSELSILPGHRMLLNGYGYDAVKLTAIGGMLSIIFSLISIPFLFILIPFIYNTSNFIILLILILFIIWYLLTQKKRMIALLCFLLSGHLGLISLQLPLNNTLILFPILSGLFGISTLIMQLKSKSHIPKQKQGINISKKTILQGSLFGTIGGLISGLLPGIGTSQIATFFTRDRNDYKFLITIGSITTSDILMSFLALLLIGKTRSGLAVLLNKIMNFGFVEFILVIPLSLISVALATAAALILAKYLSNKIQHVNYAYISLIVILFLILLTVYFLGFIGLLLLLASTSLGLFAQLSGVRRGNLMGVLLIPTILFLI